MLKKKKPFCFIDFFPIIFLFTISLISILIFSIFIYYFLPLLVWIYFTHHFSSFFLKLKLNNLRPFKFSNMSISCYRFPSDPLLYVT